MGCGAAAEREVEGLAVVIAYNVSLRYRVRKDRAVEVQVIVHLNACISVTTIKNARRL